MSNAVRKRGAFAAFLALIIAVIVIAGRDTPEAQGLAALSIVLMVAHAWVGLGRTEALTFVVVCLLVTLVVENIGAATGFPFGHYTFLVGANLPHIGSIPLIVGPLYVGMGYPSWLIANLIVNGDIRRPNSRLECLALPVAAAFVMVQWDVVMDPSGSTLARAWIWYDSGGYFGVPLSNFLGWFLTTYIYFQIFAVIALIRRNRSAYSARSAPFWSAPILLYLAAGLCHVPPLFDKDSRLVDANHKVWSAADLRETTVIVLLFTMLPTSLLALLRLARRGQSSLHDLGQ
jgi:putative membrane protein